MDFDARVAGILHEAERALAALSAEAAAGRDYDRAGTLMGLAGGVADLGRRLGSGTPQAWVGAQRSRADRPTGMNAGGPAGVAKMPLTAAPRAGRKAEFPRFRHEGDSLVKIGWSKSDRATYEHRSPRDVLDKLAGVIASLGGRGERFTTDDVLAKGSEQLADVPSYQVYLCLAFIVQQGLLERHGRQGYTVPHPGSFVSAVTEAWSALPKR